MKAPRTSIATARQRRIVTPEGLALTLTLASRGARLGALLLDLTMMGAVLVALFLAVMYTAGGVARFGQHMNGHNTADHAVQFLIVVLIAGLFLLRNAWFLAFELGPRGATPGKRLMGIRIAARDGQRLSADRVIARNLLRDVEIFLPLSVWGGMMGGTANGPLAMAAGAWLFLFAGFVLFNRDNLRAGDVIAGTWVVERPRRRLEASMAVAPAALAPTAAAYQFGAAELGLYGEFELQTLERVLRDGNETAMTAVAETICAKIGWRAPTGHEVRPFLEAYYTQLRARLERDMRMGQRKADKFAGKAPAP